MHGMSDRDVKRKKKLKKKQAKLLRHQLNSRNPLKPRGENRVSDTIKLISYNITEEPLLPPTEQRITGLDQERYQKAFYYLQDKRAEEAIPIYEDLLARYPGAGRLYNNLAECYFMVGEKNKAEELIKRNYVTNPKYLFGRIDYANYCMNHGKIEEVSIIFENLFDLKLLYPERDTFHIMEVKAFCIFMVKYFAQTKNIDTALMFLQILDSIDPDGETSLDLLPLVFSNVLENFKKTMALFPADPRKSRKEFPNPMEL